MPFYAVKAGRRTGIFETWEECEWSIKNFPSANFKTFTLKQDAETFLSKGITVLAASRKRKLYEEEKEYVMQQHVKKRMKTLDAQFLLLKQKQQKLEELKRKNAKPELSWRERSQKTREETLKIIQDENRKLKTQLKLANQSILPICAPKRVSVPRKDVNPNNYFIDGEICKQVFDESAQSLRVLNVYCDGSSITRYFGMRGGYGVFFGPDHPNNVSETMPADEAQDNNTAETWAIKRALEILCDMPIERDYDKVVIYSDSTHALGMCFGLPRGCSNNPSTEKAIMSISRSLGKLKNVQFRHVKGHRKKTDVHSLGNHQADRLAGAATSLGKQPQTICK